MPAEKKRNYTYSYSREWYEVLKDGRRLFYGTPFHFNDEVSARRSWKGSQTMTWVEAHYHDAAVSDLIKKEDNHTPVVIASQHSQAPMSRESFTQLRVAMSSIGKPKKGKSA